MSENRTRPQRGQRTTLGTRNKMTVTGLKDTDQFVYRWVNDSNIEARWDKGYDFVDREGKVVGDGSFEQARGIGTVMTKGVGMGTTAYLMKIPKDLWEEQRRVNVDEPTNDTEATMKNPETSKGSYGKIEIQKK